MPFRGVYLTGGVTGKTLKWLTKDNTFMDAYLDKGRVSPSVKLVPVYVVNSEDMGQRGAHLRAVQILKETAMTRTESEGVKRRRLNMHAYTPMMREELVPPRLSTPEYDH
eukprot:gnl/MRDRNA2_/MRDRNA2_17801_c0_seq1.p1 gnl/MRDRNA2_/MRDRNA2_17801_c0~~gnl/MRDRNA2_/MRDRNA2_17801_c0_seq1.p1  ORF type:complete len:110 (+),score=13.28 gnl/MRDRNA2_/MRDRNA2_17801_c0_seq1:339-668(+)